MTPEQTTRVEDFLPRVRSIAKSVSRLHSGLTLDDLVSAGNEGLVQAAIRYDPGSAITFIQFAHYRVRGAMIDAIRNLDRQGRRQRRALRMLELSQEQLASEVGDKGAELATLEERVAAARELVHRAAAMVVLVDVAPTGEIYDRAHPDPEEHILDQERRDALWRHVEAVCGEADRELIDECYIRDEALTDYARRRGINKSSVSRRHARLLARIGAALSQAGHDIPTAERDPER